MTVFIALGVLLTAAYLLLMVLYAYGWSKTDRFASGNALPQMKVSVIIPARNEAWRIGRLLAALCSQSYPKNLTEIIVVDDDSEDDTAKIVADFFDEGVQIIKPETLIRQGFVAFKKRALAAGITKSSGELIVTTDADCVMGNCWLATIVAFHGKRQAAMIAAPVLLAPVNSLFTAFQAIDFMTMQGITAASLKLRAGSMANGANLCFTREAFEQVKGYEGTEHLASGDDFLLMVKMQAAFPKNVFYLKSDDAIVFTPPPPDLRSFFNQRIRWASKSGKYKDPKLTAVLLMVYAFNCWLLAGFVTACFEGGFWKFLLPALGLKILAELFFLLPVAAFFKRRSLLFLFVPLQLFHIAYIVLAGFLGMLGKYSWKGRIVR